MSNFSIGGGSRGKHIYNMLAQARSRYISKFTSLTDYQLDEEYNELLKALEVFKNRVNRKFYTRLLHIERSRQMSQKEGKEREIVKDYRLKELQRSNNYKRLQFVYRQNRRANERLQKVSSPNYRKELQENITKTRAQLRQLGRHLKDAERQLQQEESRPSSPIYKQYVALQEYLAQERYLLRLQTIKNEQLSKQLQSLQQQQPRPPQVTVRVYESPRVQIKEKDMNKPQEDYLTIKTGQLRELQGKVSGLDYRLKIVESYIGESQLMKIELERLANKLEKPLQNTTSQN